MITTPTRPGYYVEGRYFRDCYHQAKARAAFLADEYGRGVSLLFLGHEASDFHEVLKLHPQRFHGKGV